MSEKEKNTTKNEEKKEKEIQAMDEDDIRIFKRIGLSPCA